MVATSLPTTCRSRRNTGSLAPLFGTLGHLTCVVWALTLSSSCTTMQVYDLAWSPTGEHIISGSTDNFARIFLVSKGNGTSSRVTAEVFTRSLGKRIPKVAEHNCYVQGVAWDLINKFIATQSSDRSMHIYSVSTKSGAFEVDAVGKISRIAHRHTCTPRLQSCPRMFHRESTESDTESVITTLIEQIKEGEFCPHRTPTGRTTSHAYHMYVLLLCPH